MIHRVLTYDLQNNFYNRNSIESGGRNLPSVSTITDYVELDGDYGSVDGVEVTCTKCGHSEESRGTEEASLTRCAYLLRENCPLGESNFYEVNP